MGAGSVSDYGTPELSNLDVDADVKAHYRSRRSGNEVSRKGTMAFTTEVDGTTFHWVHTEKAQRLKHQYLVLYETETDDGDPIVLASSVTVSADEPNDGDPVKPGSTFATTFSVARQSTLGLVDRVMQNGVNINVEL